MFIDANRPGYNDLEMSVAQMDRLLRLTRRTFFEVVSKSGQSKVPSYFVACLRFGLA
jgi:hypothetical protein